jgi:release factor glutamine methyltransferase
MKDIIARTCEDLSVNRNRAELIVAALLKKPRYEIYRHALRSNRDHWLLNARLAQLKKDIPLEYLTKSVQFRDCDLSIEPGVFIPRIETEHLIDVIANEVCRPPRRILDIGTGSGALAIALAMHFPTASVIATDISPRAIRCANKNIHRYHLESRISLVCCSVFAGLNGMFDLIVSNPPYIPSARITSLPGSVRDHEPRIALDGGIMGTRVIAAILSHMKQHTHKGSTIALEIDDSQTAYLQKILDSDHGILYSWQKDLFGRIRYLLATFT